MTARVVLVDDHALMRDGLRLLLARVPDEFDVVAEAGDGDAALIEVERHRPDLVVLDVALPGLAGAAAAAAIARVCPSARVIALSSHGEPLRVRAMLDAGARAYVVKHAAVDELLTALRTVQAGRIYVSRSVSTVAPAGVDGRALSARETEVARLVVDGLTSKEIADRLGCAVKTIETHRKQIMDKLGLQSVAALTRWAIRVGLTGLD